MKLLSTQLSCHINADSLGFSTTDELDDFSGILGQPRATEALDFGLKINKPGYNIFIGGDVGTGRVRYVLDYLQPQAAREPTPPDWLYVNNFDNPAQPRVLSLPPGLGKRLRRDLDHFIDTLLDTFPSTFDNPSYQQRKTALHSSFDHIYDEAITRVKIVAKANNIAMFYEQGSVTFTPIINGKVVDESEFAGLTEEQLQTFREQVDVLEGLLNESLLELPQWQRDLNDGLRQLRESTIQHALKPLLQPLQQKYQGQTAVNLYVAQMTNHLPRVIEEHLGEADRTNQEPASQQRKLLESLYQPNLLTSAADTGAPIIIDSSPSHLDLFGRVSYCDEGGVAFQQMSAGALHRANGGYLILDVEKLLSVDGVWPALKRCLRDRLIYSDVPPGEIQLSGMVPLRPEPIPLRVKVILIGPREIYYALDEVDQDFTEQFRVLVDFDGHFDRTNTVLKQFSLLLHSRCREAGIAELSSTAVVRLAEYAHRIAEDQQRLSARIDLIIDLAVEADFVRQSSGAGIMEVEHIDGAITARERRNGRIRDRVHEQILDGTLVIATHGKAVGQINGLSVLQVGEQPFGCPMRITATAHPGNRGVVDIERETELGMAVHSKGVMILTGYLCGFYAREFPLAISAHIAMEQSYGIVDGDSASLAELCALLSALVSQPLRQDLAITGSINQHGEIQAIGGVNEKVEAFYDICAARGLTGEQGVIIPAANQRHLMLSRRVVHAVEQGVFAVFAVATVNEALALLLDKSPGDISAKGNFPTGTFNACVVERLEAFYLLNRRTGSHKAE